MTQSENEANLQTQIDKLNLAQQEYAINVQAYKKQIAEAITKEGVTTSENDEGSIIAENIGKILETRTTLDDTIAATAEDIAQGKSAYVNGTLIEGNAIEKQINPQIVVAKSARFMDSTSNNISNAVLEKGCTYLLIHGNEFYALQAGTLTVSENCEVTNMKTVGSNSGKEYGCFIRTYLIKVDDTADATLSLTLSPGGGQGWARHFVAQLIKLD